MLCLFLERPKFRYPFLRSKIEQISLLLSTRDSIKHTSITLTRNYSSEDGAFHINRKSKLGYATRIYIETIRTTISFLTDSKNQRVSLHLSLMQSASVVTLVRIDRSRRSRCHGWSISPFLVPRCPGSSSSLPVHCFSGSPYKHGGGCTKNGGGGEVRGRVGPN